MEKFGGENLDSGPKQERTEFDYEGRITDRQKEIAEYNDEHGIEGEATKQEAAERVACKEIENLMLVALPDMMKKQTGYASFNEAPDDKKKEWTSAYEKAEKDMANNIINWMKEMYKM